MTRTLAMGVAMILGFGLPATAQSVPENGVVRGANAVRGAASGPAASAAPARHQVLFNRYQTPVMTVFIAGADGADARALVPDWGLEYSPSFSPDGQWVVFTAEPDGQADLYRIRPDGTGIEQLTDHTPRSTTRGPCRPTARPWPSSPRARVAPQTSGCWTSRRRPPRT